MSTWFKETHYNDAGVALWQHGDGSLVCVTALSDAHLINILGHIERRYYTQSKDTYKDYWEDFICEALQTWPVIEDLEIEAERRGVPVNNQCGAWCHCDSLMLHYLAHVREGKIKIPLEDEATPCSALKASTTLSPN